MNAEERIALLDATLRDAHRDVMRTIVRISQRASHTGDPDWARSSATGRQLLLVADQIKQARSTLRAQRDELRDVLSGTR